MAFKNVGTSNLGLSCTQSAKGGNAAPPTNSSLWEVDTRLGWVCVV